MDVCIKNVNDEAWRTFKAESARKGFKLGEFFTEMVSKNLKKSGWDVLLDVKKPLNAKEAKIMKDAMKEFRKDFDFR